MRQVHRVGDPGHRLETAANSPRSADASALRGEFVCLEPMAGITNAMNLAHRGVYNDLQDIPPGGSWEETFRIRPSGFGKVEGKR